MTNQLRSISDQIALSAQIQTEFATALSSSAGKSLPSAPAITVDTPNPLSLRAEFVYNFFEPKELALGGAGLQTSPVNQNIDTTKLRTLPRYVVLNWSAVDHSNLSPGNAVELNVSSIAENRQKLLAENDIAVSKLFVDYSQHELDFVSNTRSILSRLSTELTTLNGNQQRSAGEVKPTLQAAISDLYRATPEAVDQEFLSKYLSYGSSEVMVGAPRINSPALNQSLDTVYENEDIGIGVALSSTVAGSVLSSLYCADPLSDKSANAATQIVKSLDLQSVISTVRPRFNLSQYGIGQAIADNIISYKQLDDGEVPSESGMPPISFRSVGYVIEKRRATQGTTDQPNPTLNLSEPETFFVETPAITQFYDSDVAYNQTYYYSVKSVTAFRAVVTDKTTGQNFAVVFMIASEPVRAFVQCVDIEPPSAPTDFFVSLDPSTLKPMLTWNFPVDTRRSVKYFQVFRRKNRGQFRPVQLPFELVAMYDFNDLENGQGVVYDKLFDPVYFKFLLPGTENAMAKNSLIDMFGSNNRQSSSSQTVTSWIDHEFNPLDYYIYAVVAVDAHGQSSCYSNQIGVSFNRQRNTIERVDISPPGAPKTYPNLLINKQVFVDTIKNEGYSQMTVVLNPDFLGLKNIRGDDLGLIKTQESGGEYVIKLINLDLQKDQTVKFQVLDTRTNR